MTLKSKAAIKLLHQKLYNMPLWHHAWLTQDLTELEWAGTILPSISTFANLIIVPKKKDLSTP